MVYCEVLLSTSTRGRELKNLKFVEWGTSRSRPPREVVSWKACFIRIVAILPSTSTRGRELKKCQEEILAVLILSTSTRGRELKKGPQRCLRCRRIVDLHERSWVEKFSNFDKALVRRSTSTRDRELKRYYPNDDDKNEASTSTRGRELKNCCWLAGR